VSRVAAAPCDTFIVHARKAWLSGLSPKQNREIPPLDYPRVHRLKADFPELRVIINGGFTTAAASVAQLAAVDGVMIGRAAYQDTMLIVDLDLRLFGGAAVDLASALQRYVSYVERERVDGTPLRSMTRHLLGLRSGQSGGRAWRRALSELADGPTAISRLRELVAHTFSPAVTSGSPEVELAFNPL
jgi:tRNA-dihydrouridine synthase A